MLRGELACAGNSYWGFAALSERCQQASLCLQALRIERAPQVQVANMTNLLILPQQEARAAQPGIKEHRNGGDLHAVPLKEGFSWMLHVSTPQGESTR
jgi:hypothetical protein